MGTKTVVLHQTFLTQRSGKNEMGTCPWAQASIWLESRGPADPHRGPTLWMETRHLLSVVSHDTSSEEVLHVSMESLIQRSPSYEAFFFPLDLLMMFFTAEICWYTKLPLVWGPSQSFSWSTTSGVYCTLDCTKAPRPDVSEECRQRG